MVPVSKSLLNPSAAMDVITLKTSSCLVLSLYQLEHFNWTICTFPNTVLPPNSRFLGPGIFRELQIRARVNWKYSVKTVNWEGFFNKIRELGNP